MCHTSTSGSEVRHATLRSTAELLGALSHGARLGLLQTLAEGEASVSDLAHAAGLSQPSASHHLAILHSAGLVRRRRSGQRVLYRVASDAVTTLVSLSVDLVGDVGRPRGRRQT